jgi:hypothetical protein
MEWRSVDTGGLDHTATEFRKECVTKLDEPLRSGARPTLQKGDPDPRGTRVHDHIVVNASDELENGRQVEVVPTPKS